MFSVDKHPIRWLYYFKIRSGAKRCRKSTWPHGANALMTGGTLLNRVKLIRYEEWMDMICE